MAITPNSNLSGLAGKIALNTSSGKVQANPASLGIGAPVGVRAASPTTKAATPPTTLPTAQKASVQPTAAPTTYDYNTGKPLAPGQAQSTYNSNTGQKIGEPAAVSSGNPATPSYPGLMGAQIQARDQAAQAAPPPTPTYSGLVGSLANNSLRQSPVAAQGAAGLINNAQTNYGTAGPAYQDYQKKVDELQSLKSGIAKHYGDIESQAIPLEFQQGREQVLGRQYASQLDAGQQAVNQAQQGIGFQLTGNSQQQAGLTSAAGIGNTAQGQLQSGLTSAAAAAQPQLGSVGQVPFNPLDQSQGAVLGSTQPGGLNAAGSLLGQFQGAQAAGAAPGQAQAGIIGTQTQQIAGYQSALQQGQNLQSQLSDLIHTFNLNPADINAVNSGLQKIAQNVSDPRYKILQNYVNDIANTYAQVLTPPGGSATDTTRGIASSMLDATASGQSLQAVMQSLDAAARAKIAGVSTTSASAGGGSTGNTTKTGTVQTKAGAVNTDW